MINFPEKMVFPAGSWQGGPQFRIAERSTHRAQATETPQTQDHEPAWQIPHLEAEARENPRANDIRHHDRGGRHQADLPRWEFLLQTGVRKIKRKAALLAL
jgi:hypothetical protein